MVGTTLEQRSLSECGQSIDVDEGRHANAAGPHSLDQSHDTLATDGSVAEGMISAASAGVPSLLERSLPQVAATDEPAQLKEDEDGCLQQCKFQKQ